MSIPRGKAGGSVLTELMRDTEGNGRRAAGADGEALLESRGSFLLSPLDIPMLHLLDIDEDPRVNIKL